MAQRVPVAERRRQLADAALEVMLREGVSGATTRAIAAEAGVTLAILHYCYESKTDLLRVVFEDVLAAVSTRAVEQPRRQTTLGAQLEADLMSVVRAAEVDPRPVQLLHEFTQHALRDPRLADLPAQRIAAGRRRLTAYLGRLEARFGVSWAEPAEQIADAMGVLLDGVVVAWLVERDSAKALVQVRRFAEGMVRRAERRC